MKTFELDGDHGEFFLSFIKYHVFSFRTVLQKLRAIQVMFPRRQTMKNEHVVILFKSFHPPPLSMRRLFLNRIVNFFLVCLNIIFCSSSIALQKLQTMFTRFPERQTKRNVHVQKFSRPTLNASCFLLEHQ